MKTENISNYFGTKIFATRTLKQQNEISHIGKVILFDEFNIYLWHKCTNIGVANFLIAIVDILPLLFVKSFCKSLAIPWPLKHVLISWVQMFLVIFDKQSRVKSMFVFSKGYQTTLAKVLRVVLVIF